MTKQIQYKCDRCKDVYNSELKEGPISIDIIAQSICVRRWNINVFGNHLCSNCLETLEIALTVVVDKFVGPL